MRRKFRNADGVVGALCIRFATMRLPERPVSILCERLPRISRLPRSEWRRALNMACLRLSNAAPAPSRVGALGLVAASALGIDSVVGPPIDLPLMRQAHTSQLA